MRSGATLLFTFFALFACAFASPIDTRAIPSLLLHKRTETVEKALEGRTKTIGYGSKGFVYLLGAPFNGHEAVVKVINEPWTGTAPTEAKNLAGVKQLLAWGKRTGTKGEVAYLIMTHMGEDYETCAKKGLTEAEANKIVPQALERYKKEFGMEPKDKNPRNFVYHKVGAHWVAEIVDWERADGTPQHQPSAPETLTKEPGCCIQ